MKAVVVYESHWGNTAAVARAIAEGIGPDARALRTDEASPEVVGDADLIVAGAPLMAFGLPSDDMLSRLARQSGGQPPTELAHPSMRSWLANLPPRRGFHAAFETKLRWSPGAATGTIDRELERAGSRRLAPASKFVVAGQRGPLKDGELEKARDWGVRLARAMPG